jgi:transposase-like protein
MLSEQLERGEPDLLCELLRVFVQALMSADADAVCNAPYGGAQRPAQQHPQRLPATRLGHPDRHDRVGDPEAA